MSSRVRIQPVTRRDECHRMGRVNVNYQIKGSFSYDLEQIKKEVNKLYTEGKLSHKRTETSYVREWFAHNWLYSHGLFKSHTKDVDLNDDEQWYRLLIYDLIFLWRKKK